MSTQPVGGQGPLIPMPALTLPALRSAVAVLAPDRLPELIAEMQQAFDQAGQAGSTAPIRLFYRRWGVFVAIEREPDRAARLHAAEQRLGASEDEGERNTAVREIGEIVRAAHREVEALEAGGATGPGPTTRTTTGTASPTTSAKRSSVSPPNSQWSTPWSISMAPVTGE